MVPGGPNGVSDTTAVYEMPNVVGRYARGKLQEGPLDDVRVQDQHWRYFAQFLHGREEQLRGRGQEQALGEIAEEIDNVRAAWTWASERGLEEEIKNSLESLYLFHSARSRFQEGEELLEKAAAGLEASESESPEPTRERSLIRCQLQARRGALRFRLGLYESAKGILEKALPIARSLGPREEVAFCLNNLALVSRALGEYEEARGLLTEALTIGREIGDPFGIAQSQHNLGMVSFSQGAYEDARRLYEEGLAIRRGIGERPAIAFSLRELGDVAIALAEHEESRRLYQESAEIFWEIGNRWGLAGCLYNTACAAYRLGEYEEAVVLHEEALAIYTETGDPGFIANSLVGLGNVACATEDYYTAEDHFREALRNALRASDTPVTIQGLAGVATVLAKNGEEDTAVELVSLVLHNLSADEEAREKAGSLLSEVESRLEPQAVAAAVEKGKTRDVLGTAREVVEGRLTLDGLKEAAVGLAREVSVFLFTDIEGSTQLWEKRASEMSSALILHDTIVQENILVYGGRIVKHTGDGVFAVFDGGEPLRCALEIQKGLQRADWGDIGEIRIRMGLHAGVAERREDDYFGPVINRTARVMGTGWGGQIVVTPETVQECALPGEAQLRDLGVHMLKSLDEPLQLYGLVHPDLALQEFPSLHSLSAHPNNLPIQPTNFVGREDELKEIGTLLENPACKLVTLVGLRGTGKTRLALQMAAERIEEYSHGVYFVPLASTKSPDLLVSAIADALKFTFNSQEDPKVQLLNYFKEKSVLLVLDKFEELVERADILSDILQAAAKLRIIVTSQERLNLREEWVVEVGGLKYPPPGTVEGAEEYSALQLFLQGALRVKPDFSLTGEQAPHVVRICELTGGLPLGIELASAWTRIFSSREIAQEIERSIDFLGGSLRDASGRAGSLRAVFEHSWSILSAEERDVFRKISVFRGGLRREAAQQVAGDPVSPLALLTTLSSLLDKSLLRRTSSGRY